MAKNFEDGPAIDQAYRAPSQNCYSHIHEDMIQKEISTKSVTFRGQRIQTFRDLPPEVAKHRAPFAPVGQMPHDTPGVEFGATQNRSERLFIDPEGACKYAARHFVPPE